MAQYFKKQYGGEDCVTCCPVEIECDCALIDCVAHFTQYAINATRREYTGVLMVDVFRATTSLMGLSVLGTYERPVYNGEAVVTYGRSYVQAMINEWGMTGADIAGYFQELDQVLSPFLEGFLKDACACDEANEDKVDCEPLVCLFNTIQSYNQIGIGANPQSLDEWADGGICGVCYKDCAGEDAVFEK